MYPQRNSTIWSLGSLKSISQKIEVLVIIGAIIWDGKIIAEEVDEQKQKTGVESSSLQKKTPSVDDLQEYSRMEKLKSKFCAHLTFKD